MLKMPGSVAPSTPSQSMARAIPHTPESLSSMTPMDLFVTQLSCETSLEARVDAMHRLKVVADAMGTEATLSSLIPFLASNILSDAHNDQEDEILLLLAEKVGEMVPHLIPGHRAMPLLPILEKLAGVEETVVRDKAVESINKIVPLLLPPARQETAPSSPSPSPTPSPSKTPNNGSPHAPFILLLAMAKRLSGADWFTSKVSAAGVLPTIYSFVDKTMAANNTENSGADHSPVSHTTMDDFGNVISSGPMNSTSSAGEEARRELRVLYKDLAEDDTPMVRRSAAGHLGRFVEAVAGISYQTNGKGNGGSSVPPPPSAAMRGITSRSAPPRMLSTTPARISQTRKNAILEDCIGVFQELSRDEQDSVRLLAVAAAGSVGRALGMDANFNSDLVLPVVRTGCVDLSWRVRHNLAKEFANVASSFGFHLHPSTAPRQTEVFLCYAGLLQDAEAEVRTAAVGNLAHMTSLGGGDLFMAHVAPSLPSLAGDPVMEVRSRLAQTMMDCCGNEESEEDGFGENSGRQRLSDAVILQVFRPLLEGFLNDEFAEVQLHILGKLSRVSHLLNKMDAVVHSILQMSESQNWRVREAVAHLLPHLADAMGVNFFKDQLLDLWLKLLLDQVADVRSACVKGMPRLLRCAGAQWLQHEILPHYRRVYDESHQSYLTRITVLRCYISLAEEASRNTGLLDELLTLILRGLDDRVANVRMIAARGLGEICEFYEESVVTSKIRPALQAKASEDEDDDCRFFSQLSLESCS